MSSRIPVLVDGRIFTLQDKGGISQLYAYVLASPQWRRHLQTWLLVYPGHERNLHLQASGLLTADDVRVVPCPIPPSDNDNYNLPEHDRQRAEVVRATGCCFRAVVNTYYGENVLPDCARYIVTGLDFAHEELPELAERPSTSGVLRRKRLAFEQADWACFISNASRERFFVHFPGYNRQRTSVIYLGHEPTRPQAPRVRNLVLHVGSRGLYKNFVVVAAALRRLMEREGQVRLLLLGGEPAEATVDALRRDFPSRVIFDPKPSDAAMDLAMASAWIYVSASRYEGFGIPLLNAMRLGAHPVVSDIPVYREVAGPHARYFDPCSADALHDALVDALSCEPKPRRIWRTWDDVAAEYATLLCHG